MTKRPIIKIDRTKCNGCGLCTTACAEGALALDSENKAYLVKEIYCDGLGACLNICPTGALQIIEKETEDYNPNKTYEHVKNLRGSNAAAEVHGIKKQTAPLGCGCPGTMAQEITKTESKTTNSKENVSELSQWPIQLKLISPEAPYFNECDLLIAADCTAFSFGQFHADLLKGKKLVIACPKLDESSNYTKKLAELIRKNTIYSVTVVIMSVPCCTGLYEIVSLAITESGKNIAIKKLVIDLNGSIKN